MLQDPNGALRASADTERRIDGEVVSVLKEAYGRVTALLVRSASQTMHLCTATRRRTRTPSSTALRGCVVRGTLCGSCGSCAQSR